ncbi:MAG: Uma2 family endonuclease, partial [Acidobacteria bacterium]|nr:Uma2 family endonuclease [Acidobacteriota bacterium]
MSYGKAQPYTMPKDDDWYVLTEKKTRVYYPESDGQPMAETDVHRDLMIELISSLDRHFAAEKDVYVSGNLFLYYLQGEPSACLAPDVLFVRGIAKKRRRTYKLWQEKRAPNVVFEISSHKTTKEDFSKKKQVYALLGVAEYYIFDPEYEQQPPLRAYRLRGRQYREVSIKNHRIKSEELNLELVDTGVTLRLFDQQTGKYLPTREEESALRKEAEVRAKQAETFAKQAETLAKQA